jgi:hypothetical protein
MIFSNSDELLVAGAEDSPQAESGAQIGPGGSPRETGLCSLVVIWILDQEPVVAHGSAPNCVVIVLVLRLNRQCH